MSKILITGGRGFIGRALCENLQSNNYLVHISSRTNIYPTSKKVISFNTGEIDHKTKWNKALKGVDCIIHCAARTHNMKELDKNSLESFRKVNVEGTINLAKQAAANGVRRILFLSSVKVNGERTEGFSSFKNDDIPKPEDAYGISKWEAEKGLREVSRRTGIEIVIIRSPLVYGYGVKGNLKRLVKLINYSIPLPFSLIKNQRSIIGIDNLVDILIKCINNQNANGKIFLVSDDEDVTTPELLHYIASAMSKTAYLFPIPVSLLKFLCGLIGKKNEIDRLIGSLKLDINFTKKTLNWKPPVNVFEGIKRMITKR